MKRKFTIIGGDLRLVRLAEMLSYDNEVITYGLELAKDLKKYKNIKFAEGLKEAIYNSEIIIGPMPFSRNEKNIFSILTQKEIKIQDVIELAKNKTFIAGGLNQKLIKDAEQNDIKIIDLMNYEELTVLNTIATAEGTVKIAIERTEKNIFSAEVIILGFGRVAKTTAQKFAVLGAKVTCSARKIEDFAWMEVYRI